MASGGTLQLVEMAAPLLSCWAAVCCVLMMVGGGWSKVYSVVASGSTILRNSKDLKSLNPKNKQQNELQK
jgi:hypothetical protein